MSQKTGWLSGGFWPILPLGFGGIRRLEETLGHGMAEKRPVGIGNPGGHGYRCAPGRSSSERVGIEKVVVHGCKQQ